jgi:hypothetical protein
MRFINTIFSATILLFGASFTPATYALENKCGASFGDAVQLNEARYDVYPNSGDDSGAIKCALDAAATQTGVNTVRLTEGTYILSSDENGRSAIDVTDFQGTLEGDGINKTEVRIDEEVFDCSEAKARPIIFRGGNVTLQYLTISATNPCDDADEGSGRVNDRSDARPDATAHAANTPPKPFRSEGGHSAFTLVSFAQKSCSARSHFATLNRVRLLGLSPEDYNSTGVSFFGTIDGSCEADKKGPTGSFKVNQSEILGFSTGVYSSVWGGGQVDITNNTIASMAWGIYVEDANQKLNVASNKIYVGDELIGTTTYPWCCMVGIEIAANNDYAPKENSSSINKNTITMGEFAPKGTDYIESLGIVIGAWGTVRPTHPVSITNNTFELSVPNSDEAWVWGVSVQDTNDALIKDNIFRGPGNVAIWFGAWGIDEIATGGTIIGNYFNKFESRGDQGTIDFGWSKDSLVFSNNGPHTVTGETETNVILID